MVKGKNLEHNFLKMVDITIFLILVLLLVVHLISSTHAHQLTCLTGATCGNREEQCCDDNRLGPICYSPQTHNCVNNPAGGFTLCPVGHNACGIGQCYNPTVYQCLHDQFFELCPVNHGLCRVGRSPVCYNLVTHSCFNGNILCSVNDRPCREVCIDPLRYICQNGSIQAIPPNTNVTCGLNTICERDELCCNDRCYNPATEVCITPTPNLFGPVVCQRGEVACQLRNQPSAICIDARRFFCRSMAPGNQVCPIGGSLSMCSTTGVPHV